jgi:cell division protein ZapA|tara:strand:+ start:2013 stop:2309 length:297 start_codon:yes stop_codon:yes gene_type:complete
LVHILDKEYQVACPEGQQEDLIVSARYLDRQMRSIRDTGKVIGLERIAVMAALNISHELLQATQQAAQHNASLDAQAVANLQQKLDTALSRLRQLEIN